MNNHQNPATKPPLLRAQTVSTTNVRSSAALQGATSAFLPKELGATTKLSTTTATPTYGARYAALAAGTGSHRISPPRVAHRSNGINLDVSPERGRPVKLARDGIENTSTAAISSSARLLSAKPVPLRRSASTIAAQYASSQPVSPRRSPNRSPCQTYNRSNQKVISGSSANNIGEALSGALASLVASPVEENHGHTPIQIRVLDFEKLPSLQATSTNPSTIESKSQAASQQTSKITSPHDTSNVTNTTGGHDGIRYRVRSISGVPDARTPLTRGSSDTSAMSAATEFDTTYPAGTSISQTRPPIPVRRSHRAQRTSPVSNSPNERSGMTVSNLADAMMGASLASSRAASPAKRPGPPPPPSRRRSRSISALNDLVASYELDKPKSVVKRPKPPRPMKHTLRKPSASDDEEPENTKRGRRHWMRKHPNMHHEGDRKRWRDKVTEAERRRYEGVFAANRGLHIGPGFFMPSPSALSDLTAEGNRVANIVVRDMWERSRLPCEILMEVYDLVSPEEEQSLGRDQFVVGMWLIDQRLKGRKLPVRVSASVWGSVRHPDGIKMKSRAA